MTQAHRSISEDGAPAREGGSTPTGAMRGGPARRGRGARLWAIATLAILAAACQPIQRPADPPPQPQAPLEAGPAIEAEPSRPLPTGPAQIALLVPLSGSASAIGGDLLDAAQLALFAAGDSNAVLRPKDTRSTEEGAIAAVNEALAEGAEIVIGPLFGRSAAAIRPILAAADVKALAFTNAEEPIGAPVWAMGFRPSEQIERVAAYAARRGSETIAALAPDDAFGRAALAGLNRAAQRGATFELGAVAYYPPGSGDPSTQVREVTSWDSRAAALERERSRLLSSGADQSEIDALDAASSFGSAPFDALVVADGGIGLRAVASSLAFFDAADARVLGPMRWLDDRRAFREPAMEGAWLAAPAPAELARFEREFQSAFARQPADAPLAVLAYDATALAVLLSRRDRAYRASSLTDPNGFTGRGGPFRLTADGLAEHALAILEVRGGRTVEIDPAPQRFGVSLTN